MSDIILKMENIHKRFPGVYALKQVNFQLKYGEVHALLGENGAGKSTLMKILGGIYQAEEGNIYIKNEKCDIKNVRDSQGKGVSIIHQELCLVPYLSVSENIFLGREKTKKLSGFVDYEELNKEAQKILDSLELDIKATDKVSDLSMAQRQMVEICKALSVNADILVMDEPTAALTDKEVDMLFKTIKNLKQNNISIVYISHRMEELFAIADRVTVLRDGTYVGTKEISNTTHDELIAMMVGRELKELYKKDDHTTEGVILEVKNLNNDNLKDINFFLKKGEILGVSGIVGAGRTELARAIFGIDSINTGEILINGETIKINSPGDAINYGIGLVPESRKDEGLVLIRSVAYNTTLTVLDKFMKFIRINKNEEKRIIHKYMDELSIKTPDENQLVKNLSGGNQQKIVIAKWLATKPRVLILDEPTRGVDVGAKAEIYSIINNLAKEGVSIIMISSELPEIINMSDRVLVMYKGQIMNELTKNDITQEEIMKYATGGINHAS